MVSSYHLGMRRTELQVENAKMSFYTSELLGLSQCLVVQKKICFHGAFQWISTANLSVWKAICLQSFKKVFQVFVASVIRQQTQKLGRRDVPTEEEL